MDVRNKRHKKHYTILSVKECSCCGNYIKQNLIDRMPNAALDYFCYLFINKGKKIIKRVIIDPDTKLPTTKIIDIKKEILARRRANQFHSTVKL